MIPSFLFFSFSCPVLAGQSHERWNDVAGGWLTDGEIHFSLLMKDKRGESRPISEQSACHLRQKGSKLP
jgi:hypothetical protein